MDCSREYMLELLRTYVQLLKALLVVASATHLFCDLKDHFSGKIRDDPSGHLTFSGKIWDDPSGHFTSGLSLSVKGDLSIDHM